MFTDPTAQAYLATGISVFAGIVGGGIAVFLGLVGGAALKWAGGRPCLRRHRED